jgi:hypothetical protein
VRHQWLATLTKRSFHLPVPEAGAVLIFITQLADTTPPAITRDWSMSSTSPLPFAQVDQNLGDRQNIIGLDLSDLLTIHVPIRR